MPAQSCLSSGWAITYLCAVSHGYPAVMKHLQLAHMMSLIEVLANISQFNLSYMTSYVVSNVVAGLSANTVLAASDPVQAGFAILTAM